ncbi:MAG TPA: hypothetical protein VHL98_18885 [Microvirga sp.]|jgi:hypothetical protein|nr:hypothetical protein [Microvirga sp.]
MTSFSAPLMRGITVLGIGVVLATGHVLFAAAAPVPARTVADVPARVNARDVETTASVAPPVIVRENCYSEQQIVRSVRGKTMMLTSLECD